MGDRGTAVGETAVPATRQATAAAEIRVKSPTKPVQVKTHAHPRPTSSAHPRVGMKKNEVSPTPKRRVNRDQMETDRGWIEWVKKRNRYYPRRRRWIGTPGNWKKSKPVYITSKLGSKTEDEYEQYKERRKAARDIRKRKHA